MKQKITLLLTICLLCTLALPIYAQDNSEQKILTKKEVINLALQQNSELKKLRKNVEIAEAQLSQAKSAFYPRFDLNSNYTRSQEKSLVSNSRDTYSTTFSLNQPIFQGGQLWAGYDEAKNRLKIAKLKLQQKEEEMIYQVSKEYYNVLKAKKMIGVYKQQLEKNEFYLKKAKLNKGVGIHTKTDVLQAEINYTQTEQNLLEAENNLETAKLNLKNTLELADEINLQVKDELTWQEKVINPDQAYKYALENKTLFKLLTLQQENVQLRLKRAELSDKYPNISLSSSYNTTSDQLSIEDGEWQIGLSLNYNLFNGGQNKAKIKELTKEVDKTKISLKQTKDNTKLGIKQTVLKLNEAKAKIKLSRLSLKQAQENLKHSEIRFEEGMITSYELLDAQTTLQQIKTNYYQTIYDYNLAIAKLYEIMGKTDL